MYDDYSTPRTRRHRKHLKGDHSDCDPERCEEAARLQEEYDRAHPDFVDKMRERVRKKLREHNDPFIAEDC